MADQFQLMWWHWVSGGFPGRLWAKLAEVNTWTVKPCAWGDNGPHATCLSSPSTLSEDLHTHLQQVLKTAHIPWTTANDKELGNEQGNDHDYFNPGSWSTLIDSTAISAQVAEMTMEFTVHNLFSLEWAEEKKVATLNSNS